MESNTGNLPNFEYSIPLVWKRLLSLPTCFHYCWKCPLGWDKTSHTFISTKSPGLLIEWIIVVFVITPAILVSSTVIILLNIYGLISPPLTVLLLCSIFEITSFLLVTVELSIYLHVEQIKKPAIILYSGKRKYV